ncbi:tetratricopeptide repeat protein [Aspergillus tanneri]|uniref:Uncharacterized protein n=1 Tax=Aspergillus tanneri TaxID=1220188 RepID=A0A5M9MZQ1_9EURO|nr:uncharacterized protein ATNIH1004_002830 [Aspergillus tanneri]KAA8650149.1 hypothetical protein ATNIH1004_002830 [Aspergillus tanneri]
MELFAELVFRTGTYLWEKEQPQAARSFFEFGLRLDISHSTKNSAQAYRLLGHIALDMAQPAVALSSYEQALNIRKSLEGPNSPSVADVYDSIACSYTEQGNVVDAFEYLLKAVNIHNANNPLLMARTQAIYAMTYLRAGQPDKALIALQHCWHLQDLTEEQVIQSKYPKHSGDIILLARIKYAQGLKEEAQQLASRTISILSRMLEADDENVLAARLLGEIVEMSRGVPEMQGHLARSLWFLAIVEDKMGESSTAEPLKAEAKNARNKICGNEGMNDIGNDSFMNLVPWMLW